MLIFILVSEMNPDCYFGIYFEVINTYVLDENSMFRKPKTTDDCCGKSK